MAAIRIRRIQGMNKVKINDSGLEATRICLGTGRFGSAIPEENAFEILDLYAEKGGNFLDTANVYASWLPGGRGKSETTIGRWLKRTGVGASVKVGTKGGHPDLEDYSVSRLSPEEIHHDLEESLERLGIDRVDLYWLHRDDPEIPAGEILDALNQWMGKGLIGAIGASNWTPERLAAAAEYAASHGLTGFCASQVAFSAAAPQDKFDRPGTLAMNEAARSYHQNTGLPVFAYSSQAKGFFAGGYERSSATDPAARQTAQAYFTEENFQRLDRVRKLADELGRSPNEVALAYLFGQTFPVVAIVGSRTAEQLTSSCAAADLTLTDAQIRFVQTGKR
jgi:aryl-alcohol dehydrogenase-like predicted oxidoreductase